MIIKKIKAIYINMGKANMGRRSDPLLAVPVARPRSPSRAPGARLLRRPYWRSTQCPRDSCLRTPRQLLWLLHRLASFPPKFFQILISLIMFIIALLRSISWVISKESSIIRFFDGISIWWRFIIWVFHIIVSALCFFAFGFLLLVVVLIWSLDVSLLCWRLTFIIFFRCFVDFLFGIQLWIVQASRSHLSLSTGETSTPHPASKQLPQWSELCNTQAIWKPSSLCNPHHEGPRGFWSCREKITTLLLLCSWSGPCQSEVNPITHPERCTHRTTTCYPWSTHQPSRASHEGMYLGQLEGSPSPHQGCLCCLPVPTGHVCSAELQSPRVQMPLDQLQCFPTLSGCP